MKKLCLILVLLLASFNLYGQTAEQNLHYSWNYGGQDITFTLRLNQQLYQHYLKSQPTKGQDLNLYYQQLITPVAGDQAVKNLAKDLKNLGKQYRLDQAMIIELAINFVQQLPYNYEEANGQTMAVADEPYVTLWRGSGTCLDKGLLAVALLRELGVGCSLLYFDAIPLAGGGTEEHIALGLACDTRAYWQGYCYVEIADAAFIGWVPKIKGHVLEADENSYYDSYNLANAQKMGRPQVLLAEVGKKYVP